jgi:hypothetical protein
MARLFGSAAMAAVLAIGFAGAPAGAEAGPGSAAPGQVSIAPGAGAAAGNSQPRPVTLINGDQLLAGAERGGGMSHELIAGTARGIGAALATMTLAGRTYVVPADALPYLGRGLDPGLFDIASLLRGQAGGRLPVEVRYAGRVPSLPGISITVAHRGIARGYLTAASAKRFGAALARQFTADHARGSYGQDGLFAGRVSISLPGAAGPRAAQGTAGPRAAQRTTDRHFPMETLTVTGTNLAGKPDTGDEVEVFNADNSTRFADPVESGNFFDKGVAKFSVPSGHYWAVGMFSQFAGKSYVGERIVVLPQFTVRGSTTVSMAGRAANSRIHMVIPRPSRVDYTLFTLLRSGASGPVVPFGWEGLLSQRVWVSPTSRKPTIGTFQAITASQLDSPKGAAGTPYEYGLAYRDTSGLIPSQRHVVHTATLAHVHAGYYQVVPALVQQFMTVGTSQTDRLLGFSGLGVIFRAPSRINEYLSAGHSLIWSDQYFQQAAVFIGSGGQIDPGKTFTPGERVTENWGGFPLHVAPDVDLTGAQNPQPLPVSASRTGNYLGVYVTPFSDNTLGDTGSGYAPIPHVKFSGRYEIDVNGTKVAGGSTVPPKPYYAIGFGTALRVTPKPSVIRLLLTAVRKGSAYPLSSASRTVWTWRSRHEAGSTVPPGWQCDSAFAAKRSSRSCAAEPMMTLQYAIAGLSLRGDTRPGRQVLRVTAGHLQLVKPITVTRAAVSVSFDGGKTWHRATVTGHGGRYTATFTAPAGVTVSLRTSAADAAGGSIAETITNAYQTSS